MKADQFDSFVEDLIGEKTDRIIVIIGSSKIDELLLCILTKYFLPVKSGKEDELLGLDRPIGTFSSRIKLCYRLGLISPDLFYLLERIRLIRNKSAHKIEFNIKKSPIREYIYEIKKGLSNRSSFQLIKKRFFDNSIENNTKELQCMFITICAILEAMHEKTKQTKGMKSTLLISNN